MYRVCLIVFRLSVAIPPTVYGAVLAPPAMTAKVFPGPRPSLADLWQNADLVIYGKVEKVSPLKSKLGKQVYEYGAQNVLYVKHQFKGTQELQMQSIVVETRVTSEAPCSFEVGMEVIAFIGKNEGRYIAGSSH